MSIAYPPIVRSYLIFVALAAAQPAVACPTRALCAAVDSGVRDEAPAAPKRTARIDLRIDRVADRDPWELDAAPPKPEAAEMPWIWQLLRRSVYDRMPTYRGDDGFSFVLSPVVVAGSFDTVPGVGIAGDF